MEKGKGKVRCLVYSRIVGYYRPTASWAEHKKLEFKERQVYDVKEYRNKEESMRQPSTPA